MITEDGKKILSKYLVGQAPAYASYIALGCGVKPKNSDYVFTESDKNQYAEKKQLDFEMFRIPIISRGYVNEDNVTKIVFTGELPTEERYEISEVGIYSAGENTTAGAYDSKTLYSFSTTENWEYHTQTASGAIPAIYTPLDGSDDDNVINTTEKAFRTNADNRIFTNPSRVARYERCRFLNNIIVLSGDMSFLSTADDQNVGVESGNHIHLNGISLDFDKQAPIDQLRLAFSVINRDGINVSSLPKKVMLLVEFDSIDQNLVGESAKLSVVINHTPGHATNDFSTNRYFVVTKELQQLQKTSGFSWAEVKIVKVYATVLDINDEPSDQFFVCLDAVRLENVSTYNPLYGLTGYSVVKNINSETIVKSANTTNFIEFRFAMDVQ